MSIKINHELPVPEVLKNEYPLSNEQKSIKQQRDEEIRRISQVNPINSSFWSDHVLQITKIPYVNM